MEMYFYDKLRREVVTGIYKGMMSYSSSASVEFARISQTTIMVIFLAVI